MGLSFESGTLNNGQRYDAVGNLPQLLENLGPGVIRLGGNSADLSSFTGITQPVADGLARLLKATGWTAIYTENLLNFNAATVTADARLVGSTLGSGLYAFACGNEPDMYVPDKVETVSTSSSDQHVVAFADKPPAGAVMQVLVENLGSQAATSTLLLTGCTGSSVQVMTMAGGSPLATAGIKIQGASVAADGTFTPRAAGTITCKAGSCPLALAPYSAAVVTLSSS